MEATRLTHLGPYLLGPNDENQGIYTGDARELAKAIPDESVDLIFTDPVYQNIDDYRWLAETAARVLKPGGELLVYYAHYHLATTVAALSKFIDVRWPLVEKKMNSGGMIWEYGLFCHTKPLLWCTNGKARKGLSRIDFVWKQNEQAQVNHGWGKGEASASRWLQRYSLTQDMILEPFSGGGSILSAAKLLGRRWLAFEIDPATAERARERVRMTQPPLFVPEPEQMEMGL